MKKLLSKIQIGGARLRRALASTAVLGAVCLFLAAPLHVEAQVGIVNRYGNFLTVSNSPIILPSQTILTNVSTNVVWVYRGRGLLFSSSIATTNTTGLSNIIFGFDTTIDGTNWTTTRSLTATGTLNGVNGVLVQVLLPPTLLDNVRQIRVATQQNQYTNTAFITNMQWSVFP